MDPHSLQVLEYEQVKKLLARHAGSELARQVIDDLRPSTDRERLSLSLRQVDEARALFDANLEIPSRGLRDMARILRGAHENNRPLEPHELLTILEMLEACRALRGFFHGVIEKAPELGKLAERLLDHADLIDAIDAVVERPAAVRDDASAKLRDIRRRRRELELEVRGLMSELAQSSRYARHLRDRSFSVRNGRFVLPVKKDARGHVPGILLDKSASGETVFVEPQEVVQKTNLMSDLLLDEDREVARILLELSRRLYDQEKRLVYTQQVAAWLDFSAARGRMSAVLGLESARLVDESRIVLRRARHPLLVEQALDGTLEGEVVPLDVALGEDFRMLVVTGPNTGGKTVTLKTVGVIQLMFQSGLHVPVAPGSELPCLEGVHADIGDEQSLSQSLSTFSGHVRNVVRILDAVGPGHLVLLDELGAGTDPLEGAALGEAVLDELRRNEALAIVTTHLGSLKSYAFTRAEAENASVAFDTETLAPTYELVIGQPGASQALHIAKRHGMPERVLAEARVAAEGEKGRSEELVEQLTESRIQAERLKREARDIRVASEEELARAQAAREEAEDSRWRIENEAEAEVTRLLEEFRQAARPHLNALKNVPAGLRADAQALEDLLASGLRTESFATRRREFLAGLKKHDKVFVPRYEQVCRIEKLNRAEERLTVKVGALKMEIAFDDVSWVTPPGADGA